MAAKATKDKPLTKTEILNALAEGSGLTKKEVTAVLDELRRQGFTGNISIEYEYNWTTSVPEIKQCVDFIRAYGESYQ